MKLFLLGLVAALQLFGQLSDDEKEAFLLKGAVVREKELSVGITRPVRATLSLDGFTHDAHVQRVDESAAIKTLGTGTQLNFRDYWGFNVAAYRLDRLLGLGMVPVTVARRYKGQSAALAWWVDDVIMMERQRWEKKIDPPDRSDWNRQIHQVRVFNQLVYNTDPNLGNLLIDKNWKIWLVDYTRAFRIQTNLLAPKGLVRIDRSLLDRLREFDKASLQETLGDLLTKRELDGLIVRRDKIVELFDERIARLGASAVLYE